MSSGSDDGYRASAASITRPTFASQTAPQPAEPARAAGWVTCRREWEVRSTPEALWPFISDTHRLNYDTGNPRLRPVADPGGRLPNGYRRLRASVVEFEEEPFEWQRPVLYTSRRRFLASGLRIFAEIRVRTELVALAGGGSRVIYQMWALPGNLLGRLLAPLIIRRVCAGFERPIRTYDRLAAESGAEGCALPAARPPRFVAGGRERLDWRCAELARRGADGVLARRLADYLAGADALSLAAIRPYALADLWRAPRRGVLELCLHATRIGVLELRWEILCPLCRGAKQRAASLRQLEAETHCDSCNVDFTANFARSVEVVFTPNPDIRQHEEASYCVGGPQLTPHIVAQQLIGAGAGRILTMPLEEGRYRLRALELPGGQALRVGPDGCAEATLRASSAGWGDDELAAASPLTLRLENDTDAEQLLILERMAWNDQAATAAEITTLQIFRDLFADEALRPHQRIAVGSLTIVFTDLRDSTRLYRELGDAVAFGQVLAHFDVLKQQIAAEGGAIVKTIGDAVMAVFTQPLAALRAVLAAQAALARPGDASAPLLLKAGIHHGPCISVTLNDRLDYFGSTVNLAARLERLAHDVPGAIVISDSVWADPEVAAYRAAGPAGLSCTPIETAIKGFDGERFTIWRILAAAGGP